MVRSTYDANAEVYAQRHRMQEQNLAHLADLLLGRCRGAARILDVGAGAGSTILEVPACRGAGMVGREPALLVRADISLGSLRGGTKPTPTVQAAVQCDAEELPFASGSFDLVYANSVLHWLRIESGSAGFVRAVAEGFRVTAPGGVFGASIAGVGTAARFLAAYRSVLGQRPPAAPDVATLVEDPIGSMDLAGVVDAVWQAGGTVLDAALVYEPVLYDAPADYVADVAAYGYDTFLEPVPAEERAGVWGEIGTRFVEAVGTGPYLHDQYTIYVAAQPGGPGTAGGGAGRADRR